MLYYRLIYTTTLTLMMVFFSAYNTQALAKTPKALVTSTGQKISFSETRHRLARLLGELGEPKWSRKELTRLNKSVHAYLKVATGKRYKQTLVTLRRGDRYRPMLRAKLNRANIPQAFEALPMAESAFRFNARSRAGARGLWQFMPASARQYGLKVKRSYDQRVDPARATDAALKYLKFLNRKFSKISILLSVAAYNAGEGRIARVVRRSGIKQGRRGYSRVRRFLPKETRGYVPEFLAAALLLKDPTYFGFPVTKNRPYRYVQLRRSVAVKRIAQLTKLPIAKIRQLNPELNKYAHTPVNNYFLRLPSHAALQLGNKLSTAKVWKAVTNPITLSPTRVKTQLAKTKTKPGTISYKVRQGNHLQGIVKLFGASIAAVRKSNHIKGNDIQVGQALIIPVNNPPDKKYYRIRPGDNLGLIARRLGVAVQHLQFVNGVTNPRRLRPGQILIYYV